MIFLLLWSKESFDTNIIKSSNSRGIKFSRKVEEPESERGRSVEQAARHRSSYLSRQSLDDGVDGDAKKLHRDALVTRWLDGQG